MIIIGTINIKIKHIFFLWPLLILTSCGGDSGDSSNISYTSSIENKDNSQKSKLYCINNIVTQQNKPLNSIDSIFKAPAQRESEKLINNLPSSIDLITEDHFYLSHQKSMEEREDELFMRDKSSISFDFGFNISVNKGADIPSPTVQILMEDPEGWLEEGVYTENNGIILVEINHSPCEINSEVTVQIDDISYVGGIMKQVDMRFAYICSDVSISGRILWREDQLVEKDGPQVIPDGSWEPPKEIQNLDVTHLYLVDQQGREFYEDKKNASFTFHNEKMSNGATRVGAQIHGKLQWFGNFKTMSGNKYFEPGLYPIDVSGSPDFNNPAMDWSFVGIYIPWETDFLVSSWPNCLLEDAYFIVDAANYSEEGSIELLDIRFSNVCIDGNKANGRFYWDIDDTSQPDAPSQIPASLWDMPIERSLEDGNYLYIEGDENEFISNGLEYYLDFNDAQFVLERDWENMIVFQIYNHTSIRLDFKHMSSIDRFEEGFYGEFAFTDSSNKATGWLSVGMDGRAASQGGGWYAIDHVQYENDLLTEIVIRFEHVSNIDGRSLRGKLFWSEDGALKLLNPTQEPEGLWDANEFLKGACFGGNTMRMQVARNSVWNNRLELSDGYGGENIYAVFENVNVNHRENQSLNGWEVSLSAQYNQALGYIKSGHFFIYIKGTYNQDQLKPGFYKDLFGDNPAKGSIDVGLNHLTCSKEVGWMLIEDVVYGPSKRIDRLNMRFGISCESENTSDSSMFVRLDWVR